MKTKGIILAGGKGTRLFPITKAVCKQLLPIYDKPMIYYPLSVLMIAGIRDILIISHEEFIPSFKALFGDGSSLGLHITYKAQAEPRGIAEAFIIGEEFIGNDNVCLILGDNIFYSAGFGKVLKREINKLDGATVFGYYVKDPEAFGIVEFDEKMNAKSIVEKPKDSKSNWAVTGLYMYDHSVIQIAKDLKPSKRGEIEITDINMTYLKQKKLKVERLGRGAAWLDTGTYDGLIEASMFMKTIEDRQGLKIACLEEIAYRLGYINDAQVLETANEIPTEYGEYLKRMLADSEAGQSSL